MSSLKNVLGAVFLSLPVGTFAQGISEVQNMFAQCAGRYSAEMEHAWLFNATEADHHSALRLRFLSLLEATSISADQASQVLSWRIETKAAHAALLSTATFVTDPERSAAAKAAAQTHLLSCRTLLLDG